MDHPAEVDPVDDLIEGRTHLAGVDDDIDAIGRHRDEFDHPSRGGRAETSFRAGETVKENSVTLCERGRNDIAKLGFDLCGRARPPVNRANGNLFDLDRVVGPRLLTFAHGRAGTSQIVEKTAAPASATARPVSSGAIRTLVSGSSAAAAASITASSSVSEPEGASATSAAEGSIHSKAIS